MTNRAQTPYRSAKILIWTGTLICAAIHGLARWSEAAFFASGMGRSDFAFWSLLGAFPRVEREDFGQVPIFPAEWVLGFGLLLVAVLASGIHKPSWRHAGLRVLSAYLLVLLVGGQWVFMLWTPFMLVQPLDAEFFDEGGARVCTVGIWLLFAVGLVIIGWRRELKERWTRPSAKRASTST